MEMRKCPACRNQTAEFNRFTKNLAEFDGKSKYGLAQICCRSDRFFVSSALNFTPKKRQSKIYSHILDRSLNLRSATTLSAKSSDKFGSNLPKFIVKTAVKFTSNAQIPAYTQSASYQSSPSVRPR